MNGITGMTQLALGTELSTEQREYMELIRSSADILLTIVNDILDFSKIEAGRMELEKTLFDPSQLLDDLTGIFRVTADDKQLTLVRHNDAALPAWVVGDPTRLRQILNNLLSNALKFTPAGGTVSLIVESCVQQGGRIHLGLAVADTGIGVPADKLKTIFDAFTQADSSTTRQYGGTGLGLAIVRRLAILMGGSVHVDSAPGRGSVFHVNVALGLAADQPVNEPLNRRENDVQPSREAGCRLLLAEDNLVNQRVAAGLLKRLGHVVVTAEDGIEAIRLFRQEPRFDLIFMDMQMPNMDGIEATRAIRTLEADNKMPRIPIVALTANASEADRTRCLDAGMDDFLAKPFHADQLAEIVGRNRQGDQRN
jgi:CheY-like chemotaxis protein